MRPSLPNFAAGIFIGSVNSPWISVLLVCFGWAFIWCFYVFLLNGHRQPDYVDGHGRRISAAPAPISFWLEVWTSSFWVSLVWATVASAIRYVFFV